MYQEEHRTRNAIHTLDYISISLVFICAGVRSSLVSNLAITPACNDQLRIGDKTFNVYSKLDTILRM